MCYFSLSYDGQRKRIFILTLPFLTNRFIIAVLLLTYVANSEKEYKLVRARLLLVSPVSSDFIFLGPACNKYHIRALCPFLDFLAGNFRGSQKEARGSWLEARARKLAK